MLDRLQDIGQPSLGLAGGILLLAAALFVLGARRSRSSELCQRLLLITAALAYLVNQIIASSYSAMLDEMQARAGVDPGQLAGDLAIIEHHKIHFHLVSALALIAAALLMLLGSRDSRAS